jgi:hypothetical protein
MAELLIRAVGSVNTSASCKGDVICVRPDGWRWGKCECLPEYVIVKTPDSVDEVKKYEDVVYSDSENFIVLHRRKYHISLQEVDDRVFECKDFQEITAVSLKSSVLSRTEV